MRKLACWILAAALLAPWAALPAAAQSRIALVLGNSAYERGSIRTSLADAGLVAEALNNIGFEIMEAADLDQADLRRAFRDYIARIQAAGPEAIAFVYFSGYALEFEGENYLVPVDARLAREHDIPLEAVRLSDVLHPLAGSAGFAKIVVLDAARPLPLTLPVAPGLSPVEAPPSTLVAFSSAPGTFAEDGDAAYGAYAAAIAEMVREPGIDLDTMFARIRVRAHELTQGRETPWHSAALSGDVVLVPADGGAPDISAAPALADPILLRQPRPMREIDPEEAYGLAVAMDSLPAYTEYVETYPDSVYAPRIWAVIRARREALVWMRALKLDTREAYWTYLYRYPRGIYVADAQRRLQRLAAVTVPPQGFVPIDAIDVPPPLAREPREFVHLYPPLPRLPQNLIGPRPADLVSLPPPPPPRGPRLLPAPVGLPVVPRVGEPPRRVGPAVGVVTPVAPGVGMVAPNVPPPGAVAPGAVRPGAAAPGFGQPNVAPLPQGVPRQSVAPPPQPQIRQSVTPPAAPPPARVAPPTPPVVARPVPPAVQPAPAVTQVPRGTPGAPAPAKGPPPGRRCPVVNGVEKCG